MKTVYVGMSGGVDSSVAALLLKEQGYSVTGFTLDLWKNTSDEGIEDAKRVCEKLGIPHETVDLKDLFAEKVVKSFLNEYAKARTPNPCVTCNKYIKFGAMLDYINGKADYIATGHYAKAVHEGGKHYFRQGRDLKKDQTYMFYTLKQEQIAKILMPLGEYDKNEIRKIAEENGFLNAQKHDSQDICFLAGMSLKQFLKENAPQCLKCGDIVSADGSVLGHHNGVALYTIGQRKGLGIASSGKIYVTELDSEKNTVVLGEEKYLFSKEIFVSGVNFQYIPYPEKPVHASVKIRYAAKPAPAEIIPENGRVRIVFDEPQRAATPGQSAVFYLDDILIGGGTIENMKNKR